MSADNGIYILVTEGPEFRVAHCQAIENIEWQPNYHGLNKEEILVYFATCKVLNNLEDAFNYAKKLSEDYYVLEYGICILDHEEVLFPMEN